MATPVTPRIDFLYLSEEDMIRAGVTDMASCIDTMEDMLSLLYIGDYRMAGQNSDSHGAMMCFPAQSPHPTMPLDGPDRRFMAMPAYLGGRFGTTGVKWYGSNANNRQHGLPRSILMFTLSDTDTGAPMAFMSANLLSAYRTGAIPGVGARHFAAPDARVVGIVGPGVMAKTSLEAFMTVRPGIDTLKVKGRGQASLDSFITWVKQQYPQITTITVCHSEEDIVRDSDIVTFCTSTETGDPDLYPQVKSEWVKPGSFLSMPAACTLSDDMIAAIQPTDPGAPRVRAVVDNRGLYEAWAQEYPYPTHPTIPIVGSQFTDCIHTGRLRADAVEDLGAVVSGDQPGRQDSSEIVVLSVGGMPVEDVAWATDVYRRACEQGIGVALNLWHTPTLA